MSVVVCVRARACCARFVRCDCRHGVTHRNMPAADYALFLRSVFERITVAGGGLRKLVCDDGASYDLLDVADVESFVDERGNVVIKGPSERDLVFASDRSSHRGVMPGAEYSIAAVVAGVQGQPAGPCAKK